MQAEVLSFLGGRRKTILRDEEIIDSLPRLQLQCDWRMIGQRPTLNQPRITHSSHNLTTPSKFEMNFQHSIMSGIKMGFNSDWARFPIDPAPKSSEFDFLMHFR